MYWTKINKNIVYGKFLFLYLSLLNITKRNTGSTLPSMTFETYYSLKIPLPEYEKQKKIADFIFMILDKIKNNSQINNNLEELMKTIYQRWFIEFEFPNEEGKPYKSSGGRLVYNEELKQKIPENWNVGNCYNNNLYEIIKPGIQRFETKNYLATGNVDRSNIADGEWIQYDNRESRANMQPLPNSI